MWAPDHACLDEGSGFCVGHGMRQLPRRHMFWTRRFMCQVAKRQAAKPFSPNGHRPGYVVFRFHVVRAKSDLVTRHFFVFPIPFSVATLLPQKSGPVTSHLFLCVVHKGDPGDRPLLLPSIHPVHVFVRKNIPSDRSFFLRFIFCHVHVLCTKVIQVTGQWGL